MSGHEDFRETADRAFEEWIPRKASPEWLTLIGGPARYEPDVGTIQRGFVDPLYRLFEKDPERLLPRLAAELLAASGLDPERFHASLAALELEHLAVLALEEVPNVRSISDATLKRADMPLAVTMTVAYTARQLGVTLVANEPNLEIGARSWLAYRFMRALAADGLGAALAFDRKDAALPPISAILSTDVLVAATGAIDTPLARALERAASSREAARDACASLPAHLGAPLMRWSDRGR